MSAETWKPDGKSIMTNLKDGNGVWVVYYDNGQKWSETNYKDGREDGLSTAQHENGQKAEEETTRTTGRMGFRLLGENGQVVGNKLQGRQGGWAFDSVVRERSEVEETNYTAGRTGLRLLGTKTVGRRRRKTTRTAN